MKDNYSPLLVCGLNQHSYNLGKWSTVSPYNIMTMYVFFLKIRLIYSIIFIFGNLSEEEEYEIEERNDME